MNLKFTENPVMMPFKELKIGKTYFTEAGDIYIKTSNAISFDNCIYWSELNNEWHPDCESADELIIPVESTLIINSKERNKEVE